MILRRASLGPREPPAGSHRPSMPPPREPPRFDLRKGGPRAHVQRYLRARVGSFKDSEHAIRQFLGHYDRTSTLAQLGAGSSRERHCFVLATAVLVDELLGPAVLRTQLASKALDGIERAEAKARAGALARLRAVADGEAAALGAPLREAIEQAFASGDVVVPPRPTVHRPPLPYRLMCALDFILAHERALGPNARRRLVAALVKDWTGNPLTAERVRVNMRNRRTAARQHRPGNPLTAERVRVNMRNRRTAARQHRPACATRAVPALYMSTDAARLVALLGQLSPLRPHEACGRYHPAVVAGICLPATLPRVVATVARAQLAVRLTRLRLTALPTQSEGGVLAS
jgi:hypothetical protein